MTQFEKTSIWEAKKGDVIITKDGKKFTFIKFGRTKFVGRKSDGSQWRIPVQAFNKFTGEFDESVLEKKTDINDLKKGQLFTLIKGNGELVKETYMFIEQTMNAVIGINLASGKESRIDKSFGFKVLDLEEIKKQNNI